MTEVFKPRENMTYNEITRRWECHDQNNNLVCDGGPSIIWDDGSWSFWISEIGRYHRLDGPATSKGYWIINNKDATFEIKKFAEENDIDLENLSDADKVMIALQFG